MGIFKKFEHLNDPLVIIANVTWEKAPYTYVMDYSTMTINPK